MTIEDNKALVKRFWAAFSASRFDEALAMLSEDATWWVAGKTVVSGTYTKPKFAELVGGIASQAPEGLTVTPLLLTAEGECVSMEAESYGKFANGRVYNNFYHFMIKIRDGKIYSVREYLDTEHVTATFGP